MTFSVVKTSDFSAYRKKLTIASQAHGLRRREVVTTLSGLDPNEPAACVAFDDQLALLSASGETLDPKAIDADVAAVTEGGAAAPKREFRRGFIHPSLRGALPGAVWANKQVGPMTIPCGVVLILGGGGVGKTPLAHALAQADSASYGVVRIGEPLAGYTSDFRECARDLGRAMLTCSDIVLDSIKDLISMGSGASMKSGISRGAMASLSPWSSMACELGCTLYVPVNASTTDPEVMELLAEAARSNATMTIMHRGGDSWEYLCRQGEGLNRVAGKLKVSYDRDGRAAAKAVVTGGIRELNERAAAAAIRLSIHDWNDSARRAVSPSAN